MPHSYYIVIHAERYFESAAAAERSRLSVNAAEAAVAAAGDCIRDSTHHCVAGFMTAVLTLV